MKASVLITTYNHGKFIRQALDSVLMQKTDFDIEILIGEDDSNDETRVICKEYAEKYADKIRLFLNDRTDVIYLNGKPTGRWNFINLLNHARGRFIARCEGDDFWTDERKLQKQVDFLEKNPDFAISFHQVQWLRNGKLFREPNLPPNDKNFYEAEDLFLHDNFIRTCSVVYRNGLIRNIPRWFYTVPYGDVAMHLLFAQQGKIGYISDTMAVYRVNRGGIYSSENGFVNLVKSILTYTLVADKLGYSSKNSYKIGLSKLYYWAALEATKMREQLLSSAHSLEPASHLLLTKKFQNGALVSVIIPTFNRPQMLETSINSIISQTYQNFEIVVVNDGGLDVSGLVDSFQDPRVRYISHPKNKGLAAARNTGIRNASGLYIALLDDDDLFYPEHLETALRTLSKETPVIYTDAVRATYNRCGDNYHLSKKSIPYSIDFDRNKLLMGNLSPVNCFVFEKSLALKAGLFDETLSTLEDWDFWIRLSSLTAFKHIAKPTVQVNWRSDGTTMTSLLGPDFKKNRQKIYDKYKAEINQIPNVKEIINEFQKIWAQDWKVESPLASIIILTCNQLQYTKKCIESIFQNTRKPFELIIVDNGSTDGTVEYLESEVLGSHTDAGIKIIKNNENKGFAGGNNQGMAAAGGEYILLLNNDVVVTPGWLERMLACAGKRPEIGIVGPRSNYVSGPQLVEGVGYDTHTLKGLTEFSNKFAEANPKQAQQVLRVVGFCMLIKRTVIEKIGGMDDRYGLGNFEDDDFSLRAAIAGFQSWIALDCFIHHFGHRTFIGEKVDLGESLHKNWDVFKEKWGLPADKPYGAPYRLSEMKHTRFDPSIHYYPLGTKSAASDKSNNDVKSAETLYSAIQANLNTKPSKQVIEDLKNLIATYPGFALAHNDLGVLYYRTGDKEKARRHYERAVELTPDNINFQKNLADLYCVELGRIEEALQIYVNILKTYPQDVETLLATGQICKALEKPDDARDFFNRVLEIEPWNADARKQIEGLACQTAEACLNLESAEDAYGRIQEKLSSLTPSAAIVELEKLVESHPDFAIGHNDLGVLYYNNGNKEKALHHYRRAAHLQPENITLQKNLADFLFVEEAKVEEALQIYVNILATNPHDVETLLITGHICVALKRFGDAKEFYERVLALAPDNKDANRNLQALILHQSERLCARQDSLNDVTASDPEAESTDRNPEESEYQQAAPKTTVSIVITLDGIPKNIKECLKSIQAHTAERHELLLVNCGAAKGIVKWAQQIGKDNIHCQIIECDRQAGWAGSINRAIQKASSDIIVLMHNDVVVPQGWLKAFKMCFNLEPRIGLVGPVSNRAGGIQKMIDSDESDRLEFESAAGAFYEQNQYRRVPTHQLSDFCLAFRRELPEKIGYFDEQFVSERIAVEDFCNRATADGYPNLIAADTYVYHYDRHPVTKNASTNNSAGAEDRKKCKEKWNGAQNPHAKAFQAVLFLAQADELNQKGHMDQAIETMLNAIGVQPAEKRLYLGLAEILVAAKRFQDARDALNEMPPANPNPEIEKVVLLGYAEEGLGNYESALACIDQVLAMNPNHPQALNLKGILAYRSNDRSSAEKYFKQAIASDPSYGEPYTNLGMLRSEAEQPEEALAFFEKGFILSATDLDIATNYHAFIEKRGDFERAENVARQATDLYPNNQKIKYMLIDFLIRQGKYETAMPEIEDAIIKFGIADGILDAALKVRQKLGPMTINKSSKKAPVSLCMIIKDEEKYLARCLASVKPIVDEMIVVDTGSTDRSKDIAVTFGARVYDYEWRDDFAAARNDSISKASGEWILILDGDEVISPLDHADFYKIVKKTPRAPIAYSITTRNYNKLANIVGWVPNDGQYPAEESAIGWLPSEKVRLFYGKDQIRFEGAVHELVDPVLKRNGIEIKKCRIPVHHYGRLNKEKLDRKGEIYFDIGQKKLSEMGEDINALRELAIQATILEKNRLALELWQRLLALDPNPKLAAIAYVNIGTIYSRLGKFDHALDAGKKAFKYDPDLKEAQYNRALAELQCGNAFNTIRILEGLLRNSPDYPPAQFILSAAYCCAGQKEKGLDGIRKLKNTPLGAHLDMPCIELTQSLVAAKKMQYAVWVLGAAIECDIVNKEILDLLTACIQMKDKDPKLSEIPPTAGADRQPMKFENSPQ